MTNQTDVVVDNIEEGISNEEEADAPTTTDTPETTDGAVDDNANQIASAEDEVSITNYYTMVETKACISYRYYSSSYCGGSCNCSWCYIVFFQR